MIVESMPPERNAPKRHFALQTHLDRRGQQLAQLPGVLGGRQILLGVEIGLPVRPHVQPAVAPQGKMPRRQLGDAAKDRPRMRHVLVGQIFVERLRVDLPGHVRHLQDGLQLAGEQQPARLVTIDQRLFSQPIAGQQQLLPLGVPDGQGKHAVESGEQLGPLVFVQMDQHFRVALRAEAVAGRFEPAPQVAEIIDFAVEDDPHRAVFVGERLLAAGHVDDGQAAMPEGHAGLSRVRSFAIRPAMAAARRSSAGAWPAPRFCSARSRPRRRCRT